MARAWVWVKAGETGALSGTEDDGFEVCADEGFGYSCGKVQELVDNVKNEDEREANGDEG